jgi:hypothetical protein
MSPSEKGWPNCDRQGPKPIFFVAVLRHDESRALIQNRAFRSALKFYLRQDPACTQALLPIAFAVTESQAPRIGEGIQSCWQGKYVAGTVCATLLSKPMLARPKSMVLTAVACALLMGCRKTPVDTEATVEPGRAVIYPDGAQATQDIASALARASKEKKRVLLDFGGNWCGDCQVL